MKHREEYYRNQQILKIAEQVIPVYMQDHVQQLIEEEDDEFNGESCFFSDTLNGLIDRELAHKNVELLNTRERDSLIEIYKSFIQEQEWEVLELEKSSRTKDKQRDFVYCIHFYASESDPCHPNYQGGVSE